MILVEDISSSQLNFLGVRNNATKASHKIKSGFSLAETLFMNDIIYNCKRYFMHLKYDSGICDVYIIYILEHSIFKIYYLLFFLI